MTFDEIVMATVAPGSPLAAPLDRLFARQQREWPLLRAGLAALETMTLRPLERKGERVFLQTNPGRRRSTHAKVDAASIAARPCFLCPGNMPPQERGVACGDYVFLANPYPILGKHCTVPSRAHVPQSLRGRLSDMLTLAAALGPDMLIFYNGPGCGASAPDHFHFQSCAADPVPLVDQLRTLPADRSWAPLRHFGRRMLLGRHREEEAARSHLERALAALGTPASGEAMVNLLILAADGFFYSAVIPRAAHRPRCFFAPEPDRVAISPATLEMCGLLVLAEADQADRVDAELAHDIYTQVSLDEEAFASWIEAVH